MLLLKTFSKLKQFERQQWLPYNELKKIQEKELRSIIRWAYNTVPYYHRLFRKENLLPDDIRTAEDLRKIPILRKKDVQAHHADLISRQTPLNKLITTSTTGSTGIPLVVYHDSNSKAAGMAAMLRAYRTNGMRWKNTLLYICHERRKTDWIEYLGIHRRKFASVYTSPDELVRAHNRIKPDFIDAYPSILQAMAESKFSLVNSAHRIFSTTELLTAHTKRLLQNAFNAPVVDIYGSTEFWRLAWECPSHAGYHTDIDFAVIECCAGKDAVSAGEKGELLITGLHNYGMPLIRYALGDTAVMSGENGSCGRGLPLFDSIEGRTDDWLVMPNGEHISPRKINVLDGLDGIKQYRIVQTKRNLIIVEIVPSAQWMTSLETNVIKRIQQGLGTHKVNIVAKPVSSIPRGSGGKIRTVISRVARV